MAKRQELLEQWLEEIVGLSEFTIQPASEDASFRRYWRLYLEATTYIVMDAPPGQEDCFPFLDVAGRLYACGLNVPRILERDLANGFLLLTDLGRHCYLDVLTEENVEELYGDAMSALVKIQRDGDTVGLPPYDETLLNMEIRLFTDWLLGKHLGIGPDTGLDPVYSLLVQSALEQPRVFVHRDYHSRNLMAVEGSNPGILDFQDAVCGPVTYDLVSLLKDCYIRWPRHHVLQWARSYCQRLNTVWGRDMLEEREFLRWFELMGVQRHLKASGIFARLFHRDGKSGFLKDIPRTLTYILDLEQDYPELTDLCRLIDTTVLPRFGTGTDPCTP